LFNSLQRIFGLILGTRWTKRVDRDRAYRFRKIMNYVKFRCHAGPHCWCCTVNKRLQLLRESG